MVSHQWVSSFVIGGLKRLVVAGVLSAALHQSDIDVVPSLIQLSDASATQSGFQSASQSRNCGGGPSDDSNSDLTRWAPNSDNERNWTDLPPIVDDARLKPKLALLMFLKDGVSISNAQMWESWMNHAKAEGLSFSMLIHGRKFVNGHAYPHWFSFKHGESNDKLSMKWLEKHYVNETVPTRWCDTFDAQMLLLRQALRDPDITHLTTVSANSVPLKPLSFMYKEIEQEPATRMCMDYDWKAFGHRKNFPRAETWWLMSRSDASLFVGHEKLVRGTFKLPLSKAARCPDEESWALPLLLRKGKWKNEVGLVNECVMFTDWIDSCKAWANHAGEPCENLRGEPHTNATWQRPRQYEHVGVEAWHELTRSRFWFGRKFDNHAFLEIKAPWAPPPPPPPQATTTTTTGHHHHRPPPQATTTATGLHHHRPPPQATTTTKSRQHHHKPPQPPPQRQPTTTGTTTGHHHRPDPIQDRPE
jgi:hypothetical protein